MTAYSNTSSHENLATDASCDQWHSGLSTGLGIKPEALRYPDGIMLLRSREVDAFFDSFRTVECICLQRRMECLKVALIAVYQSRRGENQERDHEA